MERFNVTFLPDKKTVAVEKDKTILSAAISAGIYLHSACAGDGVCGRCKVIVRRGTVITQPNGVLTAQEKKQQVYLACLTTVHSDCEVEVPLHSRLDLEKLSLQELEARLRGLYSNSEELEQSEVGAQEDVFVHSPLATKLHLDLPRPNKDDALSDLERVYREIFSRSNIVVSSVAVANIRQLPELLRDSEWDVTVTLGNRNNTVELVLIEPGDTSARNFGFAFDIGTTTISGQLVDLNTKKILGTKAAYNKQAAFGSDVITRIIYAHEAGGLENLHSAVTDTMNQIIRELVEEHAIDLNDVTCVACAGNTTMMHLLLRLDPQFIRREPYVPSANFLPVMRAQEAGITINPRGLLACAPAVASYIGGDTTAGILSSGLYQESEPHLLIDIGTNGEIALGNKDFIVAVAASAGPAFEGSGVACGMRASRGAIQKVSIGPKEYEVGFSTIGEAKPRGICGSGYIDLLAAMLEVGLIDKSGKIKRQAHARIRKGDMGFEFVVAQGQETEGNSDIVITEADIENLKRAKAAIYSATAILIRHLGIDFERVSKIFIAGGFGTFLDIEKAVRIGLLPDLEREKFIFIGNSALAGARQILLSFDAMKKVNEIARKVTYFELSMDPAYMEEYMAALFFPHTDLTKFPSLKK